MELTLGKKEGVLSFLFFFFFGKTVSSLLFKFLLYCLFLAVTGSCLLHELSLVVVHGLPTAEASLAVVHRLWGAWTGRSLQHVGPVIVSRRPWSAGSVVVVHGVGCSTARGNFPDQGSNRVSYTGRWILHH